MDKRAHRLERKLEKAREDEDPDLARRRQDERRKLNQARREKERMERVIKAGVKEFHARPVEGLKSADQAFEKGHSTFEDDLRQQTYGLVTYDEFRRKREQLEKEAAERDSVLAEKRAREEEEEKRRKEEERAKKIKQQAQSLSFDPDAEAF